MILGYDATTLVGHISGVGYYTQRLLKSLSNGVGADTIERLVVLSNRPVPVERNPRVQVHEHGRFPIRSIWMQLELPLLLRRLRPDLVHFTNYLAPIASGIPYVVSFHDMTLRLFPQLHTLKKRLLTASLLPTVARGARLVLTPSESSRQDVIRLLGLDPGRVRMIPYAAPDEFRPATEGPDALKEYGIRPPYLLYVGTVEPRKNLPRTLHAFTQIAASVPDVQFVIAGQSGWDHGAAQHAAARPELRSRVLFLGYVREEHLPLLYTHATAFVYPSLYEGFGFPVVEAMACGTPVLTSLSSSMAEIAAGAAMLVDPLDEKSIGASMVALLTDGALRAELRTKGLARVAQYSWERTARETVAAYREAAALR
jgi:glycosyltransferase involved in cell wall biosynthesis